MFLSLFDDNPKVKRVFCPPQECDDKEANTDGKNGKPLLSFSWLVETGKVCALNFPIGMHPGLAKAIGVMMKLDFERAVLNRVPQIEAHPNSTSARCFSSVISTSISQRWARMSRQGMKSSSAFHASRSVFPLSPPRTLAR